MRGIEKKLLAAALAALLVGPALAQEGPGPVRGGTTGTGRINLLPPTGSQTGSTVADKDLPTASGPFADVYRAPLFNDPEVQRALKLTPEQLERLNTTVNKLRTRFEAQVGQLAGLGVRQRQARQQELVRAYARDLQDALGSILGKEQMARYRQLDLQSRGAGAFTDPEVQRRLRLSDEQVRRLTALNDTNEREARAIANAAASDPALAGRRHDTLSQNTRRSIEEILTGQQLRTWGEMVGEQFTFRPTFRGGATGGSSRR
jgi:hypothetical protein